MGSLSFQASADMKQRKLFSSKHRPEGRASSQGKVLSGNWPGFNQGTGGACVAAFQNCDGSEIVMSLPFSSISFSILFIVVKYI